MGDSGEALLRVDNIPLPEPVAVASGGSGGGGADPLLWNGALIVLVLFTFLLRGVRRTSKRHAKKA
ncbi:MAG: hypothetical protein HC858_09625 [Brachymonas sp.]|nr:hypothetical protein [Brachymonas sp.]